jgi:transcriptional regulator with XRE-family HTH domain
MAKVSTLAKLPLAATSINSQTAAGLSQAALADRLGKSASFVGKFELGELHLDIVELMVILRASNLLFDAFWTQAKFNCRMLFERSTQTSVPVIARSYKALKTDQNAPNFLI